MLTADFHWLVGLYEGEGTVGKVRKSSLQLHLTSTDEDVVRRAHQIAGFGSVYGPYPGQRGGKPTWSWKASRTAQVRWFLKLILPHLSVRRASQVFDALWHSADMTRRVRG